MSLVRALFFISADNDFVCSAVHVSGIRNEAADAISRGRIALFHQLKPNANMLPTKQIHFHLEK